MTMPKRMAVVTVPFGCCQKPFARIRTYCEHSTQALKIYTEAFVALACVVIMIIVHEAFDLSGSG